MSPRLPLQITRRARREIRAAAAWWDENRPAAPDAFRDAIDRAFELICTQPNIGTVATNAKLKPTAISDGLSNTLCASEGKAFTPYSRDGGSPPAAPPATAAEVAALVLAAPDKRIGPTRNDSTGHGVDRAREFLAISPRSER